MDTLREVVIDEARWPRMFAKLRRAGMYRSCGCAGCGSCQAAAKRFVRGVARGATSRGASAERALLRRTLDGRRFDLLVDTSATPTLVGLAVDDDRPPMDAEPPRHWPETPASEEDQEGQWPQAIGSRTAWPGAGTASHLLTVPATVWSAPGAMPQPQHDWKGPFTLDQVSNPRGRRPPREKGLYLLVWEHGAYLGVADGKGGILGRAAQHANSIYKLRFEPGTPRLNQYRLYYLIVPPPHSPRAVETQYLNAIIRRPLTEMQSASATRQRAYERIGFRNLKELESQPRLE